MGHIVLKINSKKIEKKQLKKKKQAKGGRIKIFINLINLYHGRAILEGLFKKRYLALTKLKIYGSIDDDQIENNDLLKNYGVKIIRKNLKDYIKKIIKCDIILYDMNMRENERKEAETVLMHIKHLFELNTKKTKFGKTFILISTPLTWANTPKCDGVWYEHNHRARVSHPEFEIYKKLEEQVMEASALYKNRLKTIVLLPGVTYGGGENIFTHIVLEASKPNQLVPIYEPGNQNVPLVYIKDFGGMVANIIWKFPSNYMRYVFLVQPRIMPLKDIVRVFCNGIRDGPATIIIRDKDYIHKTEQLANESIFQYLTLDLNIRPGYFQKYKFISESRKNLSDLLSYDIRKTYNIVPTKVLIVERFDAFNRERDLRPLQRYYSIPCFNCAKIATEAFAWHLDKIIAICLYTLALHHGKMFIKPENHQIFDEFVNEQLIECEGFQTEYQSKCDLYESYYKQDIQLNLEQVKMIIEDLLSFKSCSLTYGYMLTNFFYSWLGTQQIFPPNILSPEITIPKKINISPRIVIDLDYFESPKNKNTVRYLYENDRTPKEILVRNQFGQALNDIKNAIGPRLNFPIDDKPEFKKRSKQHREPLFKSALDNTLPVKSESDEINVLRKIGFTDWAEKIEKFYGDENLYNIETKSMLNDKIDIMGSNQDVTMASDQKYPTSGYEEDTTPNNYQYIKDVDDVFMCGILRNLFNILLSGIRMIGEKKSNKSLKEHAEFFLNNDPIEKSVINSMKIETKRKLFMDNVNKLLSLQK